MSFFIIEHTFGFAGDETVEIIEAESIEEACDIAYEEAIQQVEAYAISTKGYETYEEAEGYEAL